MLFSRTGKEPLGGCNVTPFAQEKVDGSALLIDGAIEVDPLAFDLEVSLIHAPRVADWPCVPAPALFKLGDILLHPPKNSRMGQSDTTFRHHLDEVTEAQFKCDVPSHTQNDDLLVKVPSLEQILCRGRFRHPGSYRRIPGLSTVCTRTLQGPCRAPFHHRGKQLTPLPFILSNICIVVINFGRVTSRPCLLSSTKKTGLSLKNLFSGRGISIFSVPMESRAVLAQGARWRGANA